MANSRSLLVYVLALVVLVVKQKSWVDASTVPIVRELAPPMPVSSSYGGKSPQSQPRPLQNQKYHHLKLEPSSQPQQLLQQNKEHVALPKPLPVPQAPLTAAPAALPPKQQPQPRLNNNNNAPTTLSIKNLWGLTAGNSPESGPYTTGYGYITGRTLNSSPSNSYMTDVDLPEHTKIDAQTASANMQNPFQNINLEPMSNLNSQLAPMTSSGLDIFQVLMGTVLGLAGSYFNIPTRAAGLFTTLRGLFWSSDEPETLKESSEKVSRRKRDVDAFQDNTDLTELANIVLAAIQSGECMQRSICLLGSRIGNSSKGRAAFTLVDKLIPESVQTNQYFVTMKKALKGGESFCDRFRCRFN